MPLLPNSTPTRLAQPTGLVGVNQQIHDTRFATLTLAAAAIPSITRFFAGAPSSDPAADRYEQGNTLYTSGNLFAIGAILLQLTSVAATALADMQKIIDYCGLRIVTAQKEYGFFPCFMLPAGGGLQAFGGQVAVTAAAAPGATSYIGASNGQPSRSAVFTLARPLEIQSNQSFWCELVGPSGTGAFGVQTLTGTVGVRIILDGVVSRLAA